MTLALDDRTVGAVGRHARLDLRFERRSGRTILAHAYAEPPLRVGRAFQLDDAAYVLVVCAGPGVFGGDQLRYRISVGSGATVLMASQSALQVHPAVSRGNVAAETEMTCEVDDGGELFCQWDPVIPFTESRLRQRIELQVRGAGRLFWSDGVMAGRVSRGEAWQFAALDHELRVSVDARLSYLERYRVAPLESRERAPARPFVAGEAKYVGTTIARHPSMQQETIESIHRTIDDEACGRSAIDLVDPGSGVAVGRCLGASGPEWHETRRRLSEQVIDQVFQRPTLRFRR